MKLHRSAWIWPGVVLVACHAPAWSQDTIRYTDRKTMKEATATGTIAEESPSQVVYKPGATAGTKEIPALDILDVKYEVPGAAKLAYNRAAAEERLSADPTAKDADRKKSLGDAIKSYQEILPRLVEGKLKFAARHVQYKVARLLTRQAEDDSEQRAAAIEALSKFITQNPDGWQINQAARTLARLQLDKEDPAAAQKTYEDLAATPRIPDQVRKECDLLIAEALIRGKKFSEAQNKLETILHSVGADEVQATRVRIYLAGCLGASGKLPEAVAQLNGIIAKTTDKGVLSLAYNTLGDCYRLNKKNGDAVWPYLWVDVIYHQDREEHWKAMEHLAKLFDDLGDKSKAKQYRERLKKEGR